MSLRGNKNEEKHRIDPPLRQVRGVNTIRKWFSAELIRSGMETTGYRVLVEHDHFEKQNFQTFARKTDRFA